jgi:hypothetical protein
MQREIYKDAFKALIGIVVSLALIRFSKGLWLAPMILYALYCVTSGKIGKAMSIYTIIVLSVLINPILLPGKGMIYSLLVRGGPLLIGLMLILNKRFSRAPRIPLGALIPFLFVACISSAEGWAPIVSYMKLVNFFVFFIGMWIGSHALGADIEGLRTLRVTFFAVAAFLIFGSLALLPFPGISTLSGLQLAIRSGNTELANEMINNQLSNPDVMSPLFCGVLSHSHAFGPFSSCILGWVLADMIFVEKRIRLPHLALVLVGVPLIYYSRSRTALLIFAMAVFMICIVYIRYIYIPPHLKGRIKNGIVAMFFLGAIAAVAMEINSQAITKWVRKTNDIAGDTRDLTEAITSSRQGLVDYCMYEFKRNPAFGSGFQVSVDTQIMMQTKGKGLILSAPIEKGLLPIMVLGETGIVGITCFIIFLMSFYSGAMRKKLYITMAMFTILLSTNIGEATFFSPGGMGGLLWTICLFGGYSIDLTLMQHNQAGAFNEDFTRYA